MQDLFVKICGITNLADAQLAIKAKADALGFVFDPESDRFVTAETAASIIAQIPDHISKVGVFVDADGKYIHNIVSRVKLSAVQLEGPEGPDDLIDYELSVIKVFRVNKSFDVEVLRNYIVDAFLLDTTSVGKGPGPGKTVDWNVALRAKEYGRIILSGGLNPDNIESAIRFVKPYGVNVCAGVEMEPGKIDPRKLSDFLARAKNLSLLDEGAESGDG